jgi:hypothetical protein
MSRAPRTREAYRRRAEEVVRRLAACVTDGDAVAIVKAPPGSGKTHTLLRVVEAAAREDLRVAVATQTNSQADDVCRRLARGSRSLRVCRFAAAKSDPDVPVPVAHEVRELSPFPIAVGTVAKWGMVEHVEPFDVVLVDEAWQMAWAHFMPLAPLAPRFVLIGDPGQIPPVITLPVERWETSPRAPHRPAPELVLADPSLPKVDLDLPATFRLPADTTALLQPFYDFPFGSWARDGDRSLTPGRARGGRDRVDDAIDRLAGGSTVIVTLPTPREGPPLERDDEIARLVVHVAQRLLERSPRIRDDDHQHRLAPENVGIAATHRVMNGAIERLLPRPLRRLIKVDTPERWQGLERQVMIVVHPLSGVTRPGDFDLNTGRLCVMASRHRVGLIVVTRDHVPDTLAACVPAAEQAIGRPDVTGRGHHAHEHFWHTLARHGMVTSAA